MQSWINFWNLFFWVSFSSFIFTSNNFTRLLFISEISWLVLYNYTLALSSINDDITLMSTSFFILAFAGLEFCIGMLLIIIFKKILKIDYFVEQTTKGTNIYTFNKHKPVNFNNFNIFK